MTESEELLLLRALLRASDFGVLLSDSQRRDLVCNRRFCLMFGLNEQSALAMPPEHIRAQVMPRLKNPAEFVRTLDEVYADPRLTREDEIELIAPRRRLLLRYTAPVTDAGGRVIGRLWTFRDITRLRLLERKVTAQSEQLRAQARQLATALRAVSGRLHKVENTLTQTQQHLFETEKLGVVGLLAASVAHDIRNILTPLTIEMTLVDQDDAPARAESLAAMRQQVDRLSLLTHQLLALSKPEVSARVPLELAALAHRVAALLKPQATLDGVAVSLRCPRRLRLVLGDPAQIEQVLVNVVLNGVQAMQSTGGALVLTVRLQKREDRAGVCVRVADTGPGIPPALRRRLFDPFVSTKPDGTGLGLFSCRRIVHAHGGAIHVRSRSGGGTLVSLWLPCAEGAASEGVHGR